MRVASLHIYPVKSIAPIDVDGIAVESQGMADDRRWLVIDAAGDQLTARTHPAMLTVSATLLEDGLLLTAPGVPDLRVTRPGPESAETVRVWNRPFAAADAGASAAEWFTRIVGVPVRMMYQFDPNSRPGRDDDHPGEVVSAADAYPLLAASTASLDQLNRWVSERRREEGEEEADPLTMRRFRPNVVIDSTEPFAEAEGKSITIGATRYRVAGECGRCVLTTIDPSSHARGKEPLRTLARHRNIDGKARFGVYLVPLHTGVIHIGDTVTID
ncbi:MOSC domain-containing protein [Stackebrandtia endophytica]|nr:MOSC N-terminal beta barrel domain-containing protein [Stackebrandtia endophytica]